MSVPVEGEGCCNVCIAHTGFIISSSSAFAARAQRTQDTGRGCTPVVACLCVSEIFPQFFFRPPFIKRWLSECRRFTLEFSSKEIAFISFSFFFWLRCCCCGCMSKWQALNLCICVHSAVEHHCVGGFGGSVVAMGGNTLLVFFFGMWG